VLYYPSNAGYDEGSWMGFHDEALDKFLNWTYAG